MKNAFPEQRAADSLEARGALLGGVPAPASAGGVDPLREVWETAPPATRLAFVRSMLPEAHPRRTAVQSAATLLELCGSTAELQAWIAGYPAAFAEASAALVVEAPPDAGEPLDALAREVLRAVRAEVAAALSRVGVTWVAPAPGEPVSEECEVVGEAPSGDVATGHIQALRRPGFRRNGHLELRAQVICASVSASASAVEARPVAAPPVPHPEPSAGEAPDWLAELQQLAGGNSGARAVVAGLASLAGASPQVADRELCRSLEPLLPLFGAGWSATMPDLPPAWLEAFARRRSQVEAWLRARFGVEVLAPRGGEVFEPASMEGTAERRTAHAHEWGTVARVQRAGLRRDGRILARAQVIRYESGGGSYGG